MPLWTCTVCGEQIRTLCKPGCHAFSHQGSCAPLKCRKCGAPREKMIQG